MVRRLTLALALAAVAPSAGARAQERAGELDASGTMEEARARFFAGAELFQEGDYEAALAEFQASYLTRPSPVVLFNIAQCQRGLFRYADAITTFEQYLREGGSELSEARIRDVRNTIAELRRRTAEIDLEVEPRGATVVVDGRTVGEAPLERPLLLAAGRRVVEVTAPDHLPLREEISVVGGEPREVRIRLAQRDTAGTLRVTAEPEEAEVRIDGLDVGVAPVERRLPRGGHVVEVLLDGFETFRSPVELATRQELDLHAVLEEAGDPTIFERWWFWTAVGVVAAAAAVGIIVAAQPSEPDPIPGNSFEGVIEL